MLAFGNIGGSVLHPWREEDLAEFLARNGWLADNDNSSVYILPSPSKKRRIRRFEAHSNYSSSNNGGGRDWYSDGSRQLFTHRRNSVTSCFNSYSDICNAVCFHCFICFHYSEPDVHSLLHKCYCFIDGRCWGFGYEFQQ